MDALLVVLGGAIAAVVQWFLTPRVQRSIRKHERREQALLELGRVLTEDVPSVRSRLVSSASVLAMTKQSIEAGDLDGNNPKVEELVEGDCREIGAAGEEWRALRGRIDWLTYLAGERLGPQHLTFELAAMRVPTFAADCEELDDDQRDARWKAERDARAALVKHVQDQVPRVDGNRPSLLDRAARRLPRRRRRGS
jgi:hypothetical protein